MLMGVQLTSLSLCEDLAGLCCCLCGHPALQALTLAGLGIAVGVQWLEDHEPAHTPASKAPGLDR